jgi:hypothetical protein
MNKKVYYHYNYMNVIQLCLSITEILFDKKTIFVDAFFKLTRMYKW